MDEGDRIVFEPDRVIRRKSVSEIDLTIQTLRAQLQKAMAMLKEMEWDQYDESVGHVCSICGQRPHADDCEKAALLREMG